METELFDAIQKAILHLRTCGQKLEIWGIEAQSGAEGIAVNLYVNHFNIPFSYTIKSGHVQLIVTP